MKPSREEFIEKIKAQFPGCMFVKSDRGLYVFVGKYVGSADVAMSIDLQAKEAGLKADVDERMADDFLVRIFGFPRKSK